MSFGGTPTLSGVLRSAKKEGIRKRNLSEQDRIRLAIKSAEAEVRTKIQDAVFNFAKTLSQGDEIDTNSLSVDFGHTEVLVFTAQKNFVSEFLEEEGFKNVKIENTGQSDGGTYWASVTFEIPCD